MILYHGSNIEVKEPKLIDSEKGKDFGVAFYLTDIKEQAERMAKRKQLIVSVNKKSVVSVYEWDEDLTTLSFKEYKEANLEWLDMVLVCRSNASYKHNFDIVKGKIADDKVGETVSLVASKLISKEEALKNLKFQKINNQYAFCTIASLTHLKFLYSYEVN